MMKKLLISACSLAMVAAPIAASAAPYGHGDNNWRAPQSNSRNWNGGYNRNDNRHNGDAAIAVGLAGLFLTAAIIGSHNYDQPAPYAARCDWETRAVPGPYYGQVRYEQVQVCR
jgi:Ni/Co efflux regulator RcnB